MSNKITYVLKKNDLFLDAYKGLWFAECLDTTVFESMSNAKAKARDEARLRPGTVVKVISGHGTENQCIETAYVLLDGMLFEVV